MDKLTISGLKFSTIIGVHAWEKQCPQNVILDISFQTDTQRIAQEDSIALAIDYDRVIQYILSYAEKNHFQLIETFVEKLAQELLQHFPTQWIQLTLHKPGALLQAKDVSITIERNK